jgi:hypothetical protein
MPRIALPFLILLASLGLLVACKKDKLENLSVPRLMVETRALNYGAIAGKTVTLPVSRTTISIQSDPVVNEFNILNVEMVKVDMGPALLVQTSGQGARDLYRASVSNMGNRIVFMVNGNAIGALMRRFKMVTSIHLSKSTMRNLDNWCLISRRPS